MLSSGAGATGIFSPPPQPAGRKNMSVPKRQICSTGLPDIRPRAPTNGTAEAWSPCWSVLEIPRGRCRPSAIFFAAVADAGVFRLRGVLVGTVAYQTYPALLGCRLPATAVQTNDVDVAQSQDVSAAIGDVTGPMLDVLVDKIRRIVPSNFPTSH